jgi:hypothetical protein
LVFTLSKGKEPKEAEMPERAEATNLIVVVYFV